MKYISLIIAILLLSLQVQAQSNIPVGMWRSHFNYSETFLIEKTNSKIFATTAHGLTYYDPSDQSLNKLSKVDGLADANISVLSFDAATQLLAIGYLSGNIDIISTDGIVNLDALKQSDVTESKAINQIAFYQNRLYVATEFGVLVIDPATNKIKESFLNLGEQGQVLAIEDIMIDADIIYLATANGVLSGDLASGDNLQDFNNWVRYKTDVIYQQGIHTLALHDGKVHAGSVDTLYQINDDVWTVVPLSLGASESIKTIREGVSDLLLLTNERVLILDKNLAWSVLPTEANAQINDLLASDQNDYWYADQSLGMTRLSNESTAHFVLDGPVSSETPKLKMVGGTLYAFPALDRNITEPVSNGLAYSTFASGKWRVVEPSEIQNFTNVSDIALRNDQPIIASFANGLLDQTSNIVYDTTNSPLRYYTDASQNILVSGVVTDRNQNIWAANFSTFSLMKLDVQGEWSKYEFGFSAAREPTSMYLSEYNQIWMPIGFTSGRGVVAYDIDGDQSRYVTSSNTGLPSSQVNDIAFGKRDEIWFATDEGVAYFPYSFGIVGDAAANVIIPIYEGRPLFEGEAVTAIAVDGGNRTWMATEAGLWLLASSGSELVEFFTIDNSPLPSNNILDIEIDPQTAEVFIATDRGIVSYRSDATDGTQVHSDVKIFPNPVLPDYTGMVGISGVVNNASIKITSVSGKLVRALNANGGTAAWDVLDYTGNRVSTGVYLIFSTNTDGTESFVGKIAVVR